MSDADPPAARAAADVAPAPRPSVVDARLAVPASTAWLTAALTQPATPRTAFAVAVAAAVIAALALLHRSRPAVGPVDAAPRSDARRRTAAAAALGIAVGSAATGLHVQALRTGPVAAAAARHGTGDLSLRLVRDPVPVISRHGHRLVLVDATATGWRPAGRRWAHTDAPVVVLALSGAWLGLLPGQRLVASARLSPPRADDTVAAVALVAASPHLVGRPPLWQRWAGRVRDRLRVSCGGLRPDPRGLVPGLVLGDVAAMPPSLTAAFRATGLTHVVAVSGANVAIVLGAVVGAARATGAGRVTRALAGAVALVAFVVLARPSPSVLRAAVMGAVVLAGTVTGRPSRGVPALSAAVLGLVVVDPFLARTPGFALSVLATAAILVLAPRWTDRLARHVPRPVAAAIAVPAAAQLACTPVIVAAFGQLSPFAIPANMLAAPAVAPATLLGISAAVLGPLAAAPAAALARLAGVPAGWLAIVARTLAAAPGSGAHWPAGWSGVGWLVLVATAAALVSRHVVRARRRAMLAQCRP